MICILAGSRLDAERFAKSQFWNDNEWFYGNEFTLVAHECRTILRLPTFFELPFSYWSRIEELANTRKRL